jgi:general secretion pathway protein B
MSYILNALRKSEQERQDGHTETLENRIQHKQHTAPKKTSFWLIILVLVNLFFLSYFIWSFSKDKDDQGTAKQAVSEVKKMIKAEPELKIKSTPITQPMPPADEKPVLEIAKLLPQQTIAEQIKSQRTKRKPTLDKTKRKEKQHTKAVKQEIKPIIQAQPLKQPEKIFAAKTEVSENQNSDYPYLSELDYNFRRTVPNIDINVYVYAEKEHDRFIMIKMQKYQQGQQIDSEMTLKEIRMNSLVIEYKNKVFQIKRQ